MNKYINYLKNKFIGNSDFIIKEITLNKSNIINLIFLETLSSQDKINEYILKPLNDNKKIKHLKDFVPGSNIKLVNNIEECENLLFNGFTLLFYKNKIYAIETKADITRAVSTNDTEASLKGPKNAFVENIQINMGLIKRRLKTAKLKSKNITIGKISKTNVGILYLDNITKMEYVDSVYLKLNKINIDIINDATSLITYLEAKSIFPTIINTERPDRCAEALSEGKIVILCDDSPAALILPGFLVDFINPFTDKYNKNSNINFTKIIRLLCFYLSIIVPGFYIAIINYNQEAIPTNLIINFAAQRNKVPFPATIECVIMLILCEILRESDLRFPSKYGSAISILGALILGDAAVSAGLVSPIMIIITAFTYISSLIFSDEEIGNAIRHYRFLMLLLCSLFGLYGLIMGVIFLNINLADINILDISYMFPISPFDKSYFKSFFFNMKTKFRSKLLTNNIRKER